jgi:hypothetical protein
MPPSSTSLTEVLAPFDDPARAISENDVEAALSRLNQSMKKADQKPGEDYRAEATAFMFMEDYDQDKLGWGTYYGPSMGFQDSAGNPIWVPDIKDITPPMISYWANRTLEAHHPVLRVRYADLCVDFSRQVTGKEAAIELKRVVIDSTLDATTKSLFLHPIDASKRLSRALDLALAVHDADRIGAVRDEIIRYIASVAKDDASGLWSCPFDLLIENKKVTLPAALREAIISDLEGRLARLSTPESSGSVDPWGAEAAAIRLARFYRTQQKKDDVRRVLKLYGECFVKLAEQASALVGSSWLQKVHEVYRDFELSGDADELAVNLRAINAKVGQQLRPMRQTIEVSTEEMETFLAAIISDGLEQSLTRVAVEFSPRRDRAEQEVQKIAKSAVLYSMLNMKIVDHDGRPVASVGGTKEDLPGRIIWHVHQEMIFSGMFLYAALERLAELYHPTPAEICDYLYQSPIFPTEQRSLIEYGVKAHLSGDSVGVIHVLIPQIEGAIRHLAHLLNVPLYKPHRNGGMLLKNLDELIREEFVAKVLGADRVTYLQALFSDQRGWNLRNDMCHGIKPAKDFQQPTANRVFHALLNLALLRASSENESEGA